jgi:hypothetical protein
MQIGVIATGVASSVTLAKICPIIVFPFGKIFASCKRWLRKNYSIGQ